MRDELDSELGGLRTYSAREVGEVLGRSARTVRRLRLDGRLRAVLVGREWRYLLEDVRAYVEGLRVGTLTGSSAASLLLHREECTLPRVMKVTGIPGPNVEH